MHCESIPAVLWLCAGLNLDAEEYPQRGDQSKLRQAFQEVFKTRTRDEWSEVFSNMDACVQPILELEEAEQHPHNRASTTFLPNPHTGGDEPAPAPRLSRTPGVGEVGPRPAMGQHTVSALQEAGVSREDLARLLKDGVIVDGSGKAKL